MGEDFIRRKADASRRRRGLAGRADRDPGIFDRAPPRRIIRFPFELAANSSASVSVGTELHLQPSANGDRFNGYCGLSLVGKVGDAADVEMLAAESEGAMVAIVTVLYPEFGQCECELLPGNTEWVSDVSAK